MSDLRHNRGERKRDGKSSPFRNRTNILRINRPGMNEEIILGSGEVLWETGG